MTTPAYNPLPAKWRAHGAFRPPQGALGLLPATGAHLLLNNAPASLLGAVLSDLAVAVATSVVDTPLAVRPGLPRRSLAGFAGSRVNVAPQAVAIISASPSIDFESAIHAAALARGVTRPLEIGWSRLESGSLASTTDAARRLHEIRDHFDADLGLVVVVDDFTGDRAGDAPMWRALLNVAGSFPAPILVVTSRAPAELDDDAVLFRLDDKRLSTENPAIGDPFQVAIERETVELGPEPVTVVKFGPRRAYAPPVRAVAPTPVKTTEEAPTKPGTVEKIFLPQTGRQLEPEERAMFGESKCTSDYLAAVKWAGQTVEDHAEIIIVPSNRDPRREAAGAVMQRVKSQLLTSGLAGKVDVKVSDTLTIAA